MKKAIVILLALGALAAVAHAEIQSEYLGRTVKSEHQRMRLCTALQKHAEQCSAVSGRAAGPSSSSSTDVHAESAAGAVQAKHSLKSRIHAKWLKTTQHTLLTMLFCFTSMFM
jgi:hypothetical protein